MFNGDKYIIPIPLADILILPNLRNYLVICKHIYFPEMPYEHPNHTASTDCILFGTKKYDFWGNLSYLCQNFEIR